MFSPRAVLASLPTVLAARRAAGRVAGLVLAGPIEYRQQYRRVRVGGSRKEPPGGVGWAASDRESGDRCPNRLAREAAREVGEGAPGKGGTGELLELAAFRLDLVVGERLLGGVRGAAGDILIPLDPVVDFLVEPVHALARTRHGTCSKEQSDSTAPFSPGYLQILIAGVHFEPTTTSL